MPLHSTFIQGNSIMLNMADDSRSPVGAHNGDFIFQHRLFMGSYWGNLHIIVKQYQTEAEIELEHAALTQRAYQGESIASPFRYRFAVAEHLTYMLPEPANVSLLRQAYPNRLFCVKPRVVDTPDRVSIPLVPRVRNTIPNAPRTSTPVINCNEMDADNEVDIDIELDIDETAPSLLPAESTLVDDGNNDDDVEYVSSSSPNLPPLAVLIDRIMRERREQNTIIIDESDDDLELNARPAKRPRGSTSDDIKGNRATVDAHQFDVFASTTPRQLSLPPPNQLILAARNILRTEFGRDLEPIPETSDVD
ncbi:hypothetical protein CONPUDRAFT_160487 [Coniophora puteana RWD-64-598 SS2]|uniref:Uncharacterized protein n=1 Tax=Coniophora puteana (strain RWD-64-598) TaxID=741705 RepID=R7SDP2_CONPW|nr:uncharacterized protein CONPUDRAFT_160487 [Coniophora puteana RWD-64-598 SS2]EIW73995.1 hypothetical protein CONPUDRAFT_160487 [Coniophora puteana RWD-64-598 SS2]